MSRKREKERDLKVVENIEEVNEEEVLEGDAVLTEDEEEIEIDQDKEKKGFFKRVSKKKLAVIGGAAVVVLTTGAVVVKRFFGKKSGDDMYLDCEDASESQIDEVKERFSEFMDGLNNGETSEE